MRAVLAARAAILLVLVFSSSCSFIPTNDASFAKRLKTTDGLMLSGDARLVRKELSALARRAGHDAGRWNSILKRERSLVFAGGGVDRYVERIGAASRACGERATFGYLLAEAYVSSGRGKEALSALGALGRAGIDPPGLAKALEGTGRPVALAAVLSAAGGSEFRPSALSPESWDAIALASGDPGYLINAAIASLLIGDRPGAAMRAVEASRGGANVAPGLLYACGLYEELTRTIESRTEPAPAVAADALYLSGDAAGARRLWLERTGLPDGGTYRDWLNAALSDPDPESGAAFLSEAVERFPQRPELKHALASLVVRAGLDGPAYVSGPAPTEDAYLDEWIECARSMRGDEAARAEADALRLLSRYPEKADLAEFVFMSLLALDRPEGAFQALALHEAARGGEDGKERAETKGGPPAVAPGFALPYVLVARGDLEGAAEIFKAENARNADAASALNAALLLRASLRGGEAIEALKKSIDIARDGEGKADLFKALGDAYLEHGDRGLARASYEAALSRDPWDEEASRKLGMLAPLDPEDR